MYYPIAQECLFKAYQIAKKKGFEVKHPIIIKAEETGEYRNPLKGEWYLSGAIAEAYDAPNNLSMPFNIAKLVIVREVKAYQKMSNV